MDGISRPPEWDNEIPHSVLPSMKHLALGNKYKWVRKFWLYGQVNESQMYEVVYA